MLKWCGGRISFIRDCRRSVMPGAVLLNRRADNAQAARWRARAPQAVAHERTLSRRGSLELSLKRAMGRGEAGSVAGWTMSWAHRKLVPASCAGLNFREIEAHLLAGALVLSWHGRACLSASSAIEKASTKASLRV
jgi:hypothetical protein